MNKRTVFDACQQFRLNRDLRRTAGLAGMHLGEGAGASVEFHDFRHYVPGDDPRHIDWAAYARSGDLTVRLYREEISPHLDVVLDVSRSMGLNDGRKPELALELAAFFLESSRREGAGAKLGVAGEAFSQSLPIESVNFEARGSVLFEHPASCVAQMKPRGMRIVISDFMTTDAPDVALRQLSANTAQLVAIMLLGPWETEPTEGEFLTLIDAETEASLPVQISSSHRRRYLERLQRIRASLREVCICSGGLFVEVCADVGLIESLKRDFLRCGLLKPY